MKTNTPPAQCLDFQSIIRMILLLIGITILLATMPARQIVAAPPASLSSTLPTFFHLDPTFGQAGVIRATDTPASRCCPVGALLADGRALLATTEDTVFTITRYLPNGNLDTAFGANGVARTPIGVNAQSIGIAIQANGSAVVVGTTGYGSVQMVIITALSLGRSKGHGPARSSR